MPSPPKTTCDVCSSGSISAFAAKRERSNSARTRSPSAGSVSSRKSSWRRRSTTSGAITRAFAVSSSAWQDSPGPSAATSFESIRSRYSSAPGPATRTKDLGRNATRIAGYCRDGVQVQGGKEGARSGLRPCAPSAGAVPDREVARPARGLGPVDRPRHVEVRGQGRGREPGLAFLGRAEHAAEDRARAGHPLRHPLVEVRHDVLGDPLARARAARPPQAERALRDRTRRAGLHRERADRVPARRARPAGDARERRAAGTGTRLAPATRDSRQVLLEEREVAARDRALGDRRAWLLG